MTKIVCLVIVFVSVTGNSVESNFPEIDPAYLDWLRAEGRYEEFSKLMSIPDPKFAKEKPIGAKTELSLHEAMFDEELEEGDIMPFMNEPEEGRQGVRFDVQPNRKWPNRQVPYIISSDFNNNQRREIEDAIIYWNDAHRHCIEMVNRTNEKDYVYIHSGRGCWTFLGRIGGRQALSLQGDICIYRGTIVHELQHVIGFGHEHNRDDRDDWIDIQWQNIPPSHAGWFKKQDPKYYNVLPTYDYYSILHAPVIIGREGEKAFIVKKDGIDENKIGRGTNLTEIDINKTAEQYCSS